MLLMPVTQILVAFNKRMLAAETGKWEGVLLALMWLRQYSIL